MSKYIKYSIIVAVICCALFALVGFKGFDVKGKFPVQGISPSKNDLTVTISAKGVVAYENRISISSPNSGRVEEVLVDAGEKIKAGQPLISLDKNNINNKIEIKQTELHAIEQKILLNTKDASDLKQLFEIGGVSKSDVEKNTLEGKVLDADKKKALLEIEDLNENKKRSIIRSPDNGFVISKKVVKGEWVSAGSEIISAAIGDERYIESFVDEYDVSRLAVNQLVEYSPDEDFKEKFIGKIKNIGKNVADGQSANTVKILISSSEQSNLNSLKVGQQLYLNFIVAEKKSALSIPVEYVFDNDNASYAYVIKNEKIIKTKINIGLRSFMFAEVLDGINSTDKIVKINELSEK